MDTFTFKQIGVIHSDHNEAKETPIQPVFAQECAGTLEVFDEYKEGLSGIEGFSHVMVFFVLHKQQQVELMVKPFMGDAKTGIFSTRHPNRPNPLGISVLKLEKVEDGILHLSGVDILDGTPVIDIKPYVEKFDCRSDIKSGWTDAIDNDTAAKRGLRDFKG